jgi:hypothetical protein
MSEMNTYPFSGLVAGSCEHVRADSKSLQRVIYFELIWVEKVKKKKADAHFPFESGVVHLFHLFI